jgi:feruloyl esterase
MKLRIAILECAFFLGFAFLHDAAAGEPGDTACAELAALSLPAAKITSAAVVAAGAFQLPGPPPPFGAPDFSKLPAFCRVAATLSPAPDSAINMEVWMPLEGWNGKFVGTGNGGAMGAIFYWEMIEPLMRGYAAANSDTGHAGGPADWSFAVGHPEKLVDNAWRAVHEMTVQAKAIVAAHYGRKPARNYWSSCSTGGRQGLMEAVRFPGDYDGLAIRAPANPWIPLIAYSVLVQQALTNPQGALPAAKLPVLREAAIAACDAGDGVTDRVIGDPERCKFDPGTAACMAADAPSCLTAGEVAAARRIYRGAVNPRTGAQISAGAAPGSELEWGALTPAALPIGANFMRDIVFARPDWDLFSFDFDKDVARLREVAEPHYDASNPDLRAFVDRGGRIVLWHCWTDGLIPARGTIEYYKAVVARLGAEKSAGHVRLFLAPGVNHCAGGEGADRFDHLGAVENWVERGVAPERLIASRKLESGGERTRPLCAWPKVARYKGDGNPDDAASFDCVAP